MLRYLLLVSLLVTPLLAADEPESIPAGTPNESAPFVPSDEVRQALLPLFHVISAADVSRVTVELAAESMIGGEVIDRQSSTYQFASQQPNQFTIYFKEENRAHADFYRRRELLCRPGSRRLSPPGPSTDQHE